MDYTWSAFSQLIAAIGIIIIILCLPTPAIDVCLTQQEARELWPREHLYWYSKNRCWSNRRGPPKNIKTDLILNNRAEVPLPKPSKTKEWGDYCCWPDINDLKAHLREQK